MNPYLNYYVNQAGSGLTGFQETRTQRGYGFFGRIFSGAILPVLKFLGRQALSAGANVAQDVLCGDNLKQSLKRQIVEQGIEAGDEALQRAKHFAQSGTGIKKKKYKRKKKKSSLTKKRKTKRKKRKKSRKKKPKKTQ